MELSKDTISADIVKLINDHGEAYSLTARKGIGEQFVVESLIEPDCYARIKFGSLDG